MPHYSFASCVINRDTARRWLQAMGWTCEPLDPNYFDSEDGKYTNTHIEDAVFLQMVRQTK